MESPGTYSQRAPAAAVRLHFQFAWWSLLAYLSVGVGLEMLHAFKIGWYLNSDYETRRLMWTLGHAHGTLLALGHVAFAVTLHVLSLAGTRGTRVASSCLMAASLLLPGGFLLGGIFLYGGDPGVGVWLVPVGALLLFTAVILTALAAAGSPSAAGPPGETPAGPPRRKRGKTGR